MLEAFNVRIFRPLEILKSKVVDQLKKKGTSKNRPDSSFDPEQLKAGTKVEMEHGLGKEAAKEIAKDHLAERSDYYVRLKKVEGTKKSLHSVVLGHKGQTISLSKANERSSYMANDLLGMGRDGKPELLIKGSDLKGVPKDGGFITVGNKKLNKETGALEPPDPLTEWDAVSQGPNEDPDEATSATMKRTDMRYNPDTGEIRITRSEPADLAIAKKGKKGGNKQPDLAARTMKRNKKH